MITVPGGHLMNIISVIGSTFSGEKPVDLSVRLIRLKRTFREYDSIWRSEKLAPAIREFTDGEDRVPDEDSSEFFEEYDFIFNEEVNVEADPIPLSDLSSVNVADDEAFELLLDLGVIVDDSEDE